MQLRKLEAYGFKSFADKTEVEFGQGITVVVGPNGSGKSNISDAIRWALGEQSIRSLRGAKSEDVIFAGSANRRALGVAEVSLVFDNSDGALPLDFNEVTITRRVFRSGDSEYYINKAACRLKDIHALLADTGLGRDAMPVIGQNKVDEVLNSKPEERRLLFEEAAGITKYKQRKRDALRKLEDTGQNLTRVQDIIGEIETQLEPLAANAARTERYNEWHGEWVACQVTQLLHKLTKAEKMLESAALQQQQLTDEEIGINTNLRVSETNAEQVTCELTQIMEQLTQWEQALHQAETDLERYDGKKALLEERITQGRCTQDRLAEQLSRLEEQRQVLERTIGELQTHIRAGERQTVSQAEIFARQTQEYQDTVNRLANLEQQLEQSQEQTFGHLQDIVSARNQVAGMERDLSRLQAQRDNLGKERQEYSTQTAMTKAQHDQLLQEQGHGVERLVQLQQAQASMVFRRNQLDITLQQSVGEEKQCAAKVQELVARDKLLSGMQQEYEGFGRGIKNVLKSSAAWRSGICGAVAELVDVPEPYVTAVEIALGGALQHIITLDDETAKQAIRFLKTQNQGRATFLPLNTIRPAGPREAELAAVKTEGAIGFAADLVQCQEVHRPAIRFLLGRTIIARHMDAAVAIAKRASFGVKVVTLDGEIINPGGSMTGGSVHRKETGFLSRHNEIEATRKKIRETQERLALIQRELDTRRTVLTALDGEIVQSQDEQRGVELRQAELAVHADKIQAETKRLALALFTLTEEIAASDSERIEIQSKLETVKQDIAGLENRDSEHKQQVAGWQQSQKALQLQRETLNGQITETKIGIAAVKQELATATARFRQASQEQAELQEQLQQCSREKAGNVLRLETSATELEALQAVRAQTQAQIDRSRQEREQAFVIKTELLTVLNRLEKELKELRRRSHELQTRLHETELLAAKYSYERDHGRKQLREQFLLNMEQAEQLQRPGTAEAMAARIHELETAIHSLGSVNPSAIEEYAQVQERYQFLLKQSQDLIQAKDCLASIIGDIDSAMVKQFTAAFQQISVHFSDTFIRLFGGGKAQLVLLEPGNLLETGIDILVQPPGKKQQNLILLSGGERALTVIALLFAFLSHRPAPFTMVDEIDAPLDEANLQRFSEFLRDYARQTQFIIVTHRKGTMEVADVIHGVTMEDSGVSKLISVKLMDKAVC